MSRTIHCCLDIRGALMGTDRQLRGWLRDDAGKLLSVREAKE